MSVFTAVKAQTGVQNPQLDLDKINRFGDGEQESVLHYIFNAGGFLGYASVGEGDALVDVNSGASFTENHANFPPGINRGAVTNIADTADAQDTICFVFRAKARDSITVIGGSLSSSGNGGGSVFHTTTSGSIRVNYRGLNGDWVASVPHAINIQQDKWYFVALSRDFSGSTKTGVLFVAGAGNKSLSGTGTYDAQGNIGIGPHRYPDFAGEDKDYAEFIYFDKPLTLSQLQSVYERSKARMAAEGIDIE